MRIAKVIAGKMVQEIIKLRSPLILYTILILVIPLLPFYLRSDGSLKNHIRIVMNYSLTLMSVFIYISTLFLGIYSLTNEIKQKQIYIIDSKPVSRWQFLLGKFLGIAFVNFIVLLSFSGVILGTLFYMYNSSKNDTEKKKVRSEIFMTYRGVFPYKNRKRIQLWVDRIYETQKKSHKLPKDQNEKEFKKELQLRLEQREHIVTFGYKRKWRFTEIPPYIKKNYKEIRLRYKLFTSQDSIGFLCKANWRVGSVIYSSKVKPGEYSELMIPTSNIHNQVLDISFMHADKKAGYIYFPLKSGIELFIPVSSFSMNFFRAICLAYIISCFIGVFAIFLATFLGFPVAIFVGLAIIFMQLATSFLVRSLPSNLTTALNAAEGILAKLNVLYVKCILFLIPNISYYSRFESLSLGRMIEWSVIVEGIFFLLLIKAGLLAIVGCYIFNNRELGKPLI